MTPVGRLLVFFNKPIFRPPIRLDTRSLQTDFELEDILDIKVPSEFDEFGIDVHEIVQVEFLNITDYYLEFQLSFQYPHSISQDISQPDYINLIFKKGDVFIDNLHYTRLEDNYTVEFPIPA